VIRYPILEERLQRRLPRLIEPALPIITKFEDSTHQLWRCHTVEGDMVLKICNTHTIQRSSFWQGMNALFDIDFPTSLAYIHETHELIGTHTFLNIPEFITSYESLFVMVTMLSGDDVKTPNEYMVMQLARHLASMHCVIYSKWGPVYEPAIEAALWPERILQIIEALNEKQSQVIPEDLIELARNEIQAINVDVFCPIMMDLRWDQMLHQQGQLSAIVDMDAYVIGPPELELILLEYQLSPEQAERFKAIYLDVADMPDLSAVRHTYRLLLFLMNSLGETDIQKWMSAPSYW
jgi:hypothetical protein